MRTACAVVIAVCLTTPMAAADRNRDGSVKPQSQPRGPTVIVVSIRKQKLRIFDEGGEIASSRVSTGMPGFDTPTGVFALLEKQAIHTSNIYSGAPMPFMQRLTWSGIALHAGVVPGYRASHGCIRLPYAFARSLFGLTRPGVRVVVAQDESQPTHFAHPKLFKPLPERAAPQVASAALADTRLAVNDAGPASETMSEFRSMLGVTPALAAAAADWRSETDRPRTRADADRRAAERVAEADSKAKIALVTQSSASDTAKTAARAAQDIADRLKAARRNAEPDSDAVRSAEANLLKSKRAFEALMNAPVVPSSIDAEEKEGDLEDVILDASIALAEARSGIARGEIELAALAAEAAAAERTRFAAVAAARQAEIDLKAAQLQLADLTKDAARRGKPLSVLISLRSNRIYLRQGFEGVIDAPIKLTEPARKIGTYVLTAMRYDPGNADALDWRLVTAQPPSFTDRDSDRRKRRANERDLPPAQGAASAVLAAALDGVIIPDEIMAMITERLRPGASIIVSDRDLNQSENGPNTEFVLLTR